MKEKNGWQRVRLDEAFWFQEGPGVRTSQFADKGIKLLNVSNITGDGLQLGNTNRYLSESEVAKKYSHFLVDAGDLVIASSGISFDEDGFLRTRGAFVQERHLPLCMNTSTIRFKSKTDVSDLRFLKFWLDSREFRTQVTRYVTGSAQQNFGPTHLKMIEISLPPLVQQQRIAAILDKAEALREKRRQAITHLDSLTQSILLTLLGDPLKFQIKLLGELVQDMHQGINTVTERIDYQDAGYPIIQSKHITQGYLNLSDARFVNEATFAKYRDKYRPRKHDVLLCNIGTIGNSLLVEEQLDFLIAWNLFLIKLDTDQVLACYCKHYFDYLVRRRYFDQFLTGGTVKFINKKTLSATPIPLPDITVQREFATRVEAVESLKRTQLTSLAKLDELFISLKYRAFRGEL